MKKLLGATLAVAMLAFAGPAQAQTSDTSSPALGQGGDESAAKDGKGQLGNWGLGLMAQTNFGVPGLGGGVLADKPLTTLGVRYWFQNAGGNTIKALGLDAGLGLGVAAGDGDTEIGFGLHLGLPMALSMHKHVNFELIPELNIGFGHTNAGGGASGVAFGLGVRAGFEVFFGFMGIPQLSLEATVGAGFGLTSIANNTRFFFGTEPEHTEPWDIFSPGIAARYYF